MGDVLGVVTSIVERALDAVRLRRRLKVKTVHGFLPGVEAHRILVMTQMTNVGQRRVVVNSCGFNVNGKPHALIPAGSTHPLPATLEDGDQVVTWLRTHVLAGQLRQYGYREVVKLRAWVGDTSGVIHRGDTIEFDIDQAVNTNQ